MDEIKKTWRLRIEGLDRFGSEDGNVPKETDVLSFQHGVCWAGEDFQERAVMNDFSVVRYMDALSPFLMKLCLNGDVLPDVEICMKAETDGNEVFRLVYHLMNARITAVRPGGSDSGSEVRPLEEVAISAERIRVEVSDRDSRGSATLDNPA